jgi:flavin reductase (DIM6/NTAB) family NADH-FMN oxidoreductase RutF
MIAPPYEAKNSITENINIRRKETMKKNLGVVPAVYPMPVLMVAAYDETGKVNVMNAAWGMICNMDRIALFIDEDHKTTQNILKTKAFTVSIADKDHMDVADFFGIATGNKMTDKFERTGYHAAKSNFVNAPVIEEFPVVMECELAEIAENESFYCVVGKILNTAADEKVLAENGKVDPAKLNALIFDQFQHGYYVSGGQVGKAWNAGAGLMKK